MPSESGLSNGSWAGARSGSENNQAYYTSSILAQKVVDITKRYKGPYVELGVGKGSLFQLLPKPKQGVELQMLRPRLEGVRYGVDALKWKPKGKAGVVIMNPPFCKQIEFFNHASEFTDTIVWIAGLNIRQWSNEDRLDEHMHLYKEWVVPPEWCVFEAGLGGRSVNIRTVVQIWTRQAHPRKKWNLHNSIHIGDQLNPSYKTTIIKRVGNPSDIGKSAPIRNTKIISKNGNFIQTNLGTLQTKLGTALAVVLDTKQLQTLHEAYRHGVIKSLLQNRTYSDSLVTLTLPILSSLLNKEWHHLKRPFVYLDHKKHQERQW